MGGGQQRGSSGSYARHGADVRYNLEITLEEAFSGVEKRFPSLVGCLRRLPRFRYGRRQRTAGMPDLPRPWQSADAPGRLFIVEQTCPNCKGRGRIVKDKCKKCGGEGVLHKEKVLKIKIPAGVESDTRMRIAGEGEPGLHGGQNGDLYVFITVKPHKLYSREGANLYTRVPVSMACAALGGK